MAEERRKQPRDPDNLTLSEIDREYDSATESEAYSSGGESVEGSDFVQCDLEDISSDEGTDKDDDSSARYDVATSPQASTSTAQSNQNKRCKAPLQPQLSWNDIPQMKTFLFNQPTGLRVPLPGNNSPIDYFSLLVDDIFLNSVIRETNIYAEETFLSSSLSENSRISNWKDLTLTEFKTFLGLLFHTGTVKMPTLQHYWSTNSLFKTCFGDFMPRDRFLLILRCLHFNQSDSNSEDRLAKIKPIVDYFNNKMLCTYSPGKELSLDESMILWRGRLVFKQYIKNKRHKYGIKLYLLTEPNGLVLKFCIYAGALDTLSGAGHTEKVVLHLLEERLGKGHAVYADNFYNSVALSKTLLSKQTYITGTLRPDRVANPKEVTTAKLKKGETLAKYHEGTLVGQWKDKRPVTYISNQYENEMTQSFNKRGEEKLKPLPIIKYNEYMSGIDRQDQLLSYYPCERKTVRWYKKLFVHIMQMCLLNSYLLYNKHQIDKKLTLLEFKTIVVEGLLTPLRQPEPRRAHKAEHRPTKQTRGANKRTLRRRCVVCYKNGIRKDTIYVCESCEEKPPLCLDQCFQSYHDGTS